MTARRALVLSVVAAVLVPVACLVIMQVTVKDSAAIERVLRFVLLVWPSAIMLMASQHATPLAGALALDPVLLMAILANVVPYVVIGMLVWAGLNHKRVFLVPAVLLVGLVVFMMWNL